MDRAAERYPRDAGRLLGPGRPAAGVFGPVPDELVLAELAAELRWGAEHAPVSMPR